MKYRFTHPTQQDFMRTVNEVTGQDLKWYWDQAVYGTQVLDYEVLRADSDRTDWYDENDPDKKGETTYETQVILHRKGDFIFPVVAEVKFDNGESTLERWDGKTAGCDMYTVKKRRWSQCRSIPAIRSRWIATT